MPFFLADFLFRAEKAIGRVSAKSVWGGLYWLGGLFSSGRMADGFDSDDEGCSECRQRFGPGSVVRYSKCCGRGVCRDCLKRMFSGMDEGPRCCGAVVSSSDFVNACLSEQMSSRSRAQRKRLANVYNARREDFSSLKEYNDYLEEAADVEYAMAYGTDEEKKAAGRRRREYERKNSDMIKRNNARRMAESARMRTGVELATAESSGASGSGWVSTRRTMNFAEPRVLSDGRKTSENSANFSAEERLRRVQLASGFRGWFDTKRSLQEAAAGLSLGLF